MRTLLALSLFLLPASVAHAGTIKENAVYCLDLKSLNSYNQYLARHEDVFRKRLLDRAECAIKGRDEFAGLLAQGDGYVVVQTLSGFKVYTNSVNFVPDGDELPQPTPNAAQTVNKLEDSAAKPHN